MAQWGLVCIRVQHTFETYLNKEIVWLLFEHLVTSKDGRLVRARVQRLCVTMIPA